MRARASPSPRRRAIPPRRLRLEDLLSCQGGSRRCGPEADRREHQASGPLRREEPQSLRHARHRGRHADPRGRRRGGRRDRRRDHGPRERRPRAPQGRRARRRPLGPPDRRGARGLRRERHRLRACQGARVRVARPGPAGPAVRRRRVLHDRCGRRRPPEDALADPGDQDRRRRRQAHLRAPGRVRLRHGRGRPARRDLGGRRDQRAALPLAEGDHGREEEAARHQGDRRRRHRHRRGRRGRLEDPGARDQRRRPRSRPARSSRTRTRTRRSRRSSRGSRKGS